MEGFSHVEQPSTKLNERLGQLTEHIQRPLSEERKQAIRHEMACLVFELLMREQSEEHRQVEIEQLEEDFKLERVDDEGTEITGI